MEADWQTGVQVCAMGHLERILLTLAIIFISITAGWYTNYLARTHRLNFSAQELIRLRNYLQFLGIFVMLPLSAMLSLWGLPNPDIALLGLPFFGLASYIAGGLLALLASRMLGLNRFQTGSMFCCGTFTNLGAVGGLVCLLMLGENSIALVALYRILEEIYYFGVAFPIAQWFGNAKTDRKFRIHPALPLIVVALLFGIVLNFTGISRPPFFGMIASTAMLLGTILFLYAIGLTLKLSAISAYIPQSIAMCAIKFIGIPVIIISLMQISGFGKMEGGLPFKTVAILCSMPVAMTALVPPSLFNLDVDLANSCWIITTVGLILVLPCLMVLVPNL